MIVYNIVKETINQPPLGKYIAYGVSVCSQQKNSCKEIVYISDVFTDINMAQKFVELCNKEQLDPVHLPELIEDMLISATI